MACGYSAQLAYPYAGTYGALRRSTYTACFNTNCSNGSFASLPTDAPTSQAGNGVSQIPGIDVVVWNYGGALVLEADFLIPDQAALKDGDVYSLSITGQDGRPLIVRRAARYETFQNCAGACQRAAFDRQNPECCPRDEVGPASELYMGGSTANGCGETYDFWCTENFRIDTTPAGCEYWTYDNIPNCMPGGFLDGGR